MAKFWRGKPTTGVNQEFLAKVQAAAKAAGATYVYVISGKRTKETNTGVANSNHLVGHAMDGYAFVPGRGKIPLGALLARSAPAYGLRSGDTPGFYPQGPWPNGTDPNHVDDGYNVNGGKPLKATKEIPEPANTPATGTLPNQRTVTPTTTDPTGTNLNQQLYSDIANIDQLPGPPTTGAPLLGGQPDLNVVPMRSAGDTWQLIASQGQVSQDTLRLASLASLAGNGGTPVQG